VHIIQDAVMTFAAANGGAYPPTEYVTHTPRDAAADNLGNKYLDKSPINPWTGKPMANTGSSILFNTDFSSRAGLTLLSGKWTVVNGQLVAPKDKNGQATGGGLLFGSTSWGDVQLDVHATLNSGPGLGVFFRPDGAKSATNAAGVNAGYCFQIDPGLGNKFFVRKRVNGVESAPLASAAVSSAFVASMNTVPHDIKISAVGDHIVVTVDGVVALDSHDSTYATGSAGLRAWYGSNVNSISANAQGGGGTAGAGSPNKGDVAYAFGSQSTTYGLVGWTSRGGAWVAQPLK
jgi:hypothetical protein